MDYRVCSRMAGAVAEKLPPNNNNKNKQIKQQQHKQEVSIVSHNRSWVEDRTPAVVLVIRWS